MTDPKEVRLSLSWPPSVNNLFLNRQGRGRIRSPEYRAWAEEAGWIIGTTKQPKLKGRVQVSIAYRAPDRRKRDIDNLLKPILDLLVTHQIIEADDSTCVRKVEAEWVETGEPCTVTIRSAA